MRHARIAFVGDPHGQWKEIHRRLLALMPDYAILVGDMFGRKENGPALTECMAPVTEAGIAWRWLPGNHDADNEVTYANVFEDGARWMLHGGIENLGGVRVAGLGGVFRGQIWHPQDGEGLPKFRSVTEFLRTLPRSQRYKGGLPIRHTTTLFQEQIDVLSQMRADVLVTHEAGSGLSKPGSSVRGFAELDELARLLGVSVAIHGHHHCSYARRLPNGILCVGLALAEVSLLDDILAAGERAGPLPE